MADLSARVVESPAEDGDRGVGRSGALAVRDDRVRRGAPRGRLTGTGIKWYVGIPRCGKTWLAKRHLAELVRSTGWPALIIDSIGEDSLAGWRHARNVREAIEWVWGAGQHATFFPQGDDDREQVDQLLRAALEPGHVNVFIDEAHTWMTARKGTSGPLLQICRRHRHSKVNLLMTSQHYTGDVPHEARSCSPEIFAFRCTDTAVLDQLRREGVDPSMIASLPEREFYRHYRGF